MMQYIKLNGDTNYLLAKGTKGDYQPSIDMNDIVSVEVEGEDENINIEYISDMDDNTLWIGSTAQTDSTEAYIKNVPERAIPHALINSVGGKSVVFNQLVNTSVQHTNTYFGVTASLVGNKVVLNGTADSTSYSFHLFEPGTLNLIVGHIYCVMLSDDSADDAYMRFRANNSYLSSSIFTLESYSSFRTYVKEGVTYTDFELNANLFDLTLMFGAGNEPATVEEFKALFPDTYYEYNAGEIISAGVDKIASKDSDNALIEEYSIPQGIKNLPLYGAGIGNIYNEIDFVNKKYIQRIGSVDLGTLTWGYDTSFTYPIFYSSSLVRGTDYLSRSGKINYMCSKYVGRAPITRTEMGASDENGKFALTRSGTSGIILQDSSYTGSAAFKAAMNGVILYYELATPIETDISELLSDNYIEVEGGGTLTFKQDETVLPVPSNIKYYVKNQVGG